MGKTSTFADALLTWYDREARVLPWRTPPGQGTTDPYHVLVSEVMLQQTTVAVVTTRFQAFLNQFPDVFALAMADEADVLAAWAGLGYYRRARSLHACAKAVVAEHDGVFPQDEATLKSLPGIGDYTAAAIAAIAFDQHAVVVDGNIERVMARVAAIDEPLPKGKKAIKEAVAGVTPAAHCGDFAQAMMDLGARICRPKSADCLLCPVRSFCISQKSGDPTVLPVKAPKKEKKEVRGTIYVIINDDGDVLCEDRPTDGLFAGMLGLPGGGWDGRSVPTVAGEPELSGTVTHILTHRRLEIDVYKTDHPQSDVEGRWLPAADAAAAMPTLFRKALERGLSSASS
ncbi:MAG: A/G-specific adenine glycosylase [Pseudomonadota bacterium]